MPQLWLAVILTINSALASVVRADAPISDPATPVYPQPPTPPVVVQEHLLNAARAHIRSKFPEVGNAFVLDAATATPNSDSMILEFSANPRLEQRIESARGPSESWTRDWIAAEISPDGEVLSSHKTLRTSTTITFKSATPLFFGRPVVAIPGRVKAGAVFAVVGDIAEGGGVRMNRTLKWEPGASYGWDLNIYPTEDGVEIRTVFTLPEPVAWQVGEPQAPDPNVATKFERELSPSSSALTESFTLTSRDTVTKLSRYKILEGDPTGTHNLKVYLNDELALDTYFEIDRDADSTDEAFQTARRIRTDALKYSSAVVASEPEVAVRFVYPGLVRALGGRRAMISIMKEETDYRFVAIEVGAPKPPVARGDKRFSTVPTTIKLEGPTGSIQISSFLLAISSNGGASWSFLEGHRTTPTTLSMVGLVLPPELSLPQMPPEAAPK